MNEGSKGPRGCTKGKECERFHPKMCTSSLNHRECLNDSCSLYHVKGTQRLNSRHPTSKRNSDEKARRQDKQYSQPQKNTPPPPADTQEVFLEMLRAWQKELMATVEQRIQETCARTVAPAAPAANPYLMEWPHPMSSRLIPQATMMEPGYLRQHRY